MNTDKGNEVADRVRDIIQSKAYIGLSKKMLQRLS